MIWSFESMYRRIDRVFAAAFSEAIRIKNFRRFSGFLLIRQPK